MDTSEEMFKSLQHSAYHQRAYNFYWVCPDCDNEVHIESDELPLFMCHWCHGDEERPISPKMKHINWEAWCKEISVEYKPEPKGSSAGPVEPIIVQSSDGCGDNRPAGQVLIVGVE